MNKRYPYFIIGLMLLFSVCAEKEYRISIMFTCPSKKEVKFGGYYYISTIEDTTLMYGHTPGEYVVHLLEGDTLFICCWKDTTSNDTLWLDLYVDGKPEIGCPISPPFYEWHIQYPLAEANP